MTYAEYQAEKSEIMHRLRMARLARLTCPECQADEACEDLIQDSIDLDVEWSVDNAQPAERK